MSIITAIGLGFGIVMLFLFISVATDLNGDYKDCLSDIGIDICQSRSLEYHSHSNSKVNCLEPMNRNIVRLHYTKDEKADCWNLATNTTKK